MRKITVHLTGKASDEVVPLRWLTAGEPWPASLRSDRKAEDLLYKGSLGQHVTPGHGTHLSRACRKLFPTSVGAA